SVDSLSEIVVLSPTFVTQSMLAQLFSPSIKQYYKNGRIPINELGNYIFPPKHPLHHIMYKVIPLMEKFEACFVSSDGTYLVVQSLLDETPPAEYQNLLKNRKHGQVLFSE